MIFLLAAFFLITPLSHAHQKAQVVVESASIYEKPDSESTVLGTAAKGAALDVSSEPKSGYYRALVPGTKKMGWIGADDIRTEAMKNSILESSVQGQLTERRKANLHRFVLMGVLDLQWMATNKQLGDIADRSIWTRLYGVELGFRATTLFTVSFRYDHFSYTKETPTLTYAGDGTGLLLDLEYSFVHELPWKMGIALAGGISNGTSLTVDEPALGVSLASEKFSAPMGELKLTARRYLGENFALGAELGGKYLDKSGVAMSDGSSQDIHYGAIFGGISLTLEF